MNKRFLAIAIAAGLAVSSNVMAEGAEIYGIAHASLNNVSADDGASVVDAWTVTSNNSRLGVKGSEDLGGGMKAVYKMEFGVDMVGQNQGPAQDETDLGFDLNGDGDALDTAVYLDTGSAGLSRRNMYVGIQGGMGTVLIGRHDTAAKMAQGKFDVFIDTIADMNANGVDTDLRVDNVLAYLSPKMGGMQLIVNLIPGEALDTGTAPGQACTPASPCDGISDAMSASFTYEAGPLYIGVAMDSGDTIADSQRFAATYAMDALQVGFLYNMRSDDALDASDNAEDEVAMGLSAKFGMGEGKHAIKAQYIDLSDTTGAANNNNDDATAITLGYDMNLSARTTAYALYNMYSPDVAGTSADVDTMSVGIVHTF